MNLTIEQIKQLLSIINLYPSIRIMHFSDKLMELDREIVALCDQNSYEFQLNATSKEYFDSATREFGENPLLHIKDFNLNIPRYATQAKLYDYLFVSSTIEDDQKDSFLQKSYGVIKNAGIIIIFVPKVESSKDYKSIYLWTELLEENNFVATNSIDISQEYDIVVSKKMHGWGG